MGRLISPLRWLAVSSLVLNIVIIITGGLVRLTESGLGCPTWPECTRGSYVPHSALGVHGVIEFGNRLITFVLIANAALTFVAAWMYRRPDGRADRKLRWLTFALGVGIPLQGVIGGITVLTELNPYLVALHLLDSMALVALAVWLVRLTWPAPAAEVSLPARALTVITFGLAWVVVSLGTVVTGSGPHAGDLHARRTGLNPADISHLHSGAVYLLVAATIACLVVVRNRAALLLLLVEIGQAAVGFVQYYSNLPIGLVAVHMLGAASTMALAANLLCSVRLRRDLRSGSAPVSDHQASAGLPPSAQPAPAASRPMHRSGPEAAAPPGPDPA